jgi:Calcineurin-like phosphoesterase
MGGVVRKPKSPHKPAAGHKPLRHRHNPANEVNPTTPPPDRAPTPTDGPQFAEPVATSDPTKFTVKHGSDKAAYTYLDSHKGSIKPRPFPIAKDAEPRTSLADAIGGKGPAVTAAIEKAGQIVFHALGDTGNTTSAIPENTVTDKLVSDFDESDPKAVPSFCYNLGDVVYSFGEAQYYYDQFYDPYRNYPAPIFAIPGNHDGMVAPTSSTPSLQAFLANFCAYGEPFHRTPEAGGLSRTAGVQPAVYFTLEAPFVRILGLYSNCLEDPGVISSQKGAVQTYSYMPDNQLDFLSAALSRIKSEKFPGAVIMAVHHPPYVAVTPSQQTAGKHGGSPLMLADLDKVCQSTGVWPHAVLSGHAHNYQRFTRYLSNRETPFIVVGNGAHGHTAMTKKGAPALRTPNEEAPLSNGNDKIIFENYDDKEFGYCRVVVDEKQLRIEYHPASDGAAMKTPDDSVTVNLATRKLIHYQLPS